MKLLVLGGTQFVGRTLVETALDSGHDVTLFNRGQSEPTGEQLFGDAVRHLRGDRGDRGNDADADLTALTATDETWDVVLDVAGYYESAVRRMAQVLEGRVSLYCFVSSTSVYGDSSEERDGAHAAAGQPRSPSYNEVVALGGMDEGTPRAVAEPGTYGSRKADCEDTVLRIFGPGRTLVIRPGYIVGPHDPFDRWSGWIWKIAQGGTVVAPSAPGQKMQWVDVRDLAEFILSRCEVLDGSVYNVVGPTHGMDARPTLQDLLETAAGVAQSGATVVYVDETALRTAAGASFQLNGLWEPVLINGEQVPDAEAASYFTLLEHCTSNDAAVAAGLKFRSLEETVRGAMHKSGTLLEGGVALSSPEQAWGLQSDDAQRVLDYVGSQSSGKHAKL